MSIKLNTRFLCRDDDTDKLTDRQEVYRNTFLGPWGSPVDRPPWLYNCTIEAGRPQTNSEFCPAVVETSTLYYLSPATSSSNIGSRILLADRQLPIRYFRCWRTDSVRSSYRAENRFERIHPRRLLTLCTSCPGSTWKYRVSSSGSTLNPIGWT